MKSPKQIRAEIKRLYGELSVEKNQLVITGLINVVKKLEWVLEE